MDYGANKYGEDMLIDRIRDLEGEISELEANNSAEELAEAVKEQLDYLDDTYGECCEDCDRENVYYAIRQLRNAVNKVTSNA